MTAGYVRSPRYWAQLSTLAAAYALVGTLSLGVMVNEGLASLVWPPSGIAIAALLLRGYRLWPGVWLGGFITNYIFSGNLTLAAVIGTGNTMEALLAFWLLRRVLASQPILDGLRSTLKFLICAVIIAPLPSATTGTLGMWAHGVLESEQLLRVFGMWFLGDLMGVLTFTPAIYLIGRRFSREFNDETLSFKAGNIEQVLLICATALVTVAVYALPSDAATHLNYLPFMLALWGALRLPLIQAIILSLLVSVIAISGTVAMLADLNRVEIIEDLTLLYLFLATQTATVLLVGAVVRDREKIAEELLKAQQKAVAASKQKSQFLTNISHEIRTPLNGIIGVTGIMLPESTSDRQREQLRIVQNSADSLLTLLNDLLDHSRIEAGKLSIDSHTFSLPQMLRDVIGLFESQAEAKGLQLRAHFSGDLPRYVVSDDTRIRQILVNIIGNALKFTEQGGITISVTQQEPPSRLDVKNDNILFSVEDSGIGIPEQSQSRIFEAFTQAEHSTARLYGGSGLGLTISRQLAEQLGGNLELKSSPGIGTRVDIVLPLRQASLNQEFSYRRTVEHRELETGTNETLVVGRHILVAEDNPVNAQVTEQMLRNLGHDVTVAVNGEMVMALWQQGFDLILMDCLMPVMDGYNATRNIRKLEREGGRRIPIVALTANAMNNEKDKCLAAGMDDYLAKPIRLHQLDSVLRRHLRHRRHTERRNA